MPNPKTANSLLSQLTAAFPELRFRPSQRFSFRPPRTIYYNPLDPNLPLLILHEIGHALIKKNDYTTDITRLKIERDAWHEAKKLCASFHIPFDSDFAESNLDSYRDWLHSRSKCRSCGLTRYQTPDGIYHCPHCDQ